MSKLRGYFIVGSKNTVSIKLAKDYKPEGTERLTLTLDKSGTASSVDILDFTSTTTSTSTSTSTSTTSTSSTSTTSTSTTSSTTTAAPGSSSTTTTTTGAPTGTSTSTTTTSSTTTTTTAGPTEGILGIAALSGDPALVLQSPGVYLVPEGQTFNITLSARGAGVSLNQSVPFSLSGTGLTTSDLSPGALTGSFTLDTISNGYFVGTKTFTAIADITTEGDETVTLSISSGILQSPTTNLVFVIQDTSQTGGTTTSTSTSTSTTSTSTTSTSTSSTSTSSTSTTSTTLPPVAPTMTISASNNNLTAGQTSTITFTISGTTSDFDISDIFITGTVGTLSALSPFATPSNSYTTTYTPPATSSGRTTLTVTTNKFSVGGVFNTASATLDIDFDTQLPSMTISSSPSSITKGQTSTITFTVTNSSYLTNTSSDFSLADVTLNDFGYLSSFSGSGSTYTAIYNPPDGVQRSATISVASSKFTVAGTNNQASNTLTLNYDTRGASLTKIANISYGGVVRQKVDLYFPPNTINPVGVICFIHGGGWGGGSKDSTTETTLATTVANNDYAVVNINYRLVSDATAGFDGTADGFFPNNVDDIVDVLRLCTEAGYGATKKHNNIDYFGLIKSIVDSTSTLIVSGSSAGGHLANFGVMKHWVDYGRTVTAVMNMAGPNDLWDGGEDNDYDEDRGMLPEIAVAVVDNYVGINPNLGYRGETEKKAASPRWYFATQALGLFFTSIKWINITNNYDTLVRTTVIARLHYALNPSQTQLINVHQNSFGLSWAPNTYDHFYTSKGEDVIIYQANRILNRTNKFYSGSSVAISIAASRMTIDVTQIATMSFRFSIACHDGSGGAGAVIPVYWRVSNRGDSSSFPAGAPIPDDRTALKNKGITASDIFVDNGVVNMTHFTDHDVNIQFRNTHLLTGTRFFAIEAYNNSGYSGDPIAVSNVVKVIGPNPAVVYSIVFTSATVGEGVNYSYTISATGTVDYGATGRWFKVMVSGRNITPNDLPDPGPGDTEPLSEAVLFDGSTLALPVSPVGQFRADLLTEGTETLRIDLFTWLNGEVEPTLSVAKDTIDIIDTSTS